MQYDLGLIGMGLLLLISLGFGVIAHLTLRPATRWLWLIAASGWFVGGLFASEVLFGSATIEELQPIIDGLMFDEALLGGLVLGLPVAIVTRYATGGQSSRATSA